MKKIQFNFDAIGFNKLFPFYILIDTDLTIKSFGTSLFKIIPTLKEKSNFLETFQIKRPFLNHWNIQDFERLDSQLIIIESLQDDGTLFRGEILKQKPYFLFIGSPWFVTMEDISKNKLKQKDFATHDSLIDLIHSLKLEKIASNELKNVVAKINKQKKVLLEDKEKINKLSLVASSNNNGVVFTDLEGKIFWSNDGYLKLTDYRKSDVINKTIISLCASEKTDESILKNIITSSASGKPFDLEVIHKKKNNHWFWARITGQPILESKSNFFQYFIIIEDITKEKEANDQLKQSESRLKSLILNLQNGVLLEDENRKILLVNSQFCKMFGIDADPTSMIGMDCSNSAEDSKKYFLESDQFVSRIHEILENKTIVINEELNLVDGRIFERRYIPINIDGAYKGHLWSYNDITTNKRFNVALSNEREKYQSIINNMNIGLMETTFDNTIVLVNNRFSVMIGYPIDFLIGNNVSDLFIDEDNADILKKKKEKRKLGQSDLYELSIKNKNGELKHWLCSGAPDYNINGEIVGSIVLYFDITETKNLQLQREKLLEDLERKNEQLTDYAQMVSHDLKSPLRSIHSLITFIKEDNDTELNAKTAEYFILIQEKVEKMDQLIQGILTYSKIETTEVIKEKIDLNDLIGQIKNILYIPAHINITINKQLPIIKSDKFRMQQLFQNLISNAINYNDKTNGFVSLSFEEFNDHYVFSVQDNGIGISKKNHEKLFQSFQLFHANKTSTGIGLSIVKKIVDNLNEKIWFESKINIGTTFFFTLHK